MLFATGVTVGLAKWIIDDTGLVFLYFSKFVPTPKKLWEAPLSYSPISLVQQVQEEDHKLL